MSNKTLPVQLYVGHKNPVGVDITAIFNENNQLEIEGMTEIIAWAGIYGLLYNNLPKKGEAGGLWIPLSIKPITSSGLERKFAPYWLLYSPDILKIFNKKEGDNYPKVIIPAASYLRTSFAEWILPHLETKNINDGLLAKEQYEAINASCYFLHTALHGIIPADDIILKYDTTEWPMLIAMECILPDGTTVVADENGVSELCGDTADDDIPKQTQVLTDAYLKVNPVMDSNTLYPN